MSDSAVAVEAQSLDRALCGNDPREELEPFVATTPQEHPCSADSKKCFMECVFCGNCLPVMDGFGGSSTFRRWDVVLDHVRNSTEVPYRPYACEICKSPETEFGTEWSFRNHMMIIHSSEKNEMEVKPRVRPYLDKLSQLFALVVQLRHNESRSGEKLESPPSLEILKQLKFDDDDLSEEISKEKRVRGEDFEKENAEGFPPFILGCELVAEHSGKESSKLSISPRRNDDIKIPCSSVEVLYFDTPVVRLSEPLKVQEAEHKIEKGEEASFHKCTENPMKRKSSHGDFQRQKPQINYPHEGLAYKIVQKIRAVNGFNSPLTCELCKKTIQVVTKPSIMWHAFTHLANKPFKCKWGCLRTVHVYQLKNHIKTAHGDDEVHTLANEDACVDERAEMDEEIKSVLKKCYPVGI